VSYFNLLLVTILANLHAGSSGKEAPHQEAAVKRRIEGQNSPGVKQKAASTLKRNQYVSRSIMFPFLTINDASTQVIFAGLLII
jgi:hypothetical protein